MKIFIKLMILALVLSYASLFILKKPDGTPIKTLDSLVPSFEFSGASEDIGEAITSLTGLFNASELPETAVQTESSQDIQSREKILYRWQDERGVWNYTDIPPPGIEAEVMELEAPTVLNLNPTLGISDTESETLPTAEINTETSQTTESETSLIPERIRQMQESIQSAEEVTSQFQERLEEQQRILNEL